MGREDTCTCNLKTVQRWHYFADLPAKHSTYPRRQQKFEVGTEVTAKCVVGNIAM
jgi:hypothetical protein